MFKFKRLSNDECAKIMCQARFVIDIPMKHQNGLTIRVFETLSRGQKLLTTNKEIINYDFYDENQIYVFDGEDIDFNSGFFNSQDHALNEQIKNYHISKWLDNLMNIGE